MDRFQILALSGGGYKGLYTAKVIERIEERIQCPIASKFDLISGTSIGGILALALSLEVPAKEIVNLFINKGTQIFKPARFGRGGFLRSKYSSESLRESLISIFGDSTISDLKHKTIIPTVNYSKGSIQIFKTSHHKDFKNDYKRKIIDVALSTSAAPIYFPINSLEYGDFVDGGIVANHPGLFAYIESVRFLDIIPDNIYQLHIGTLSSNNSSSGKSFFMKSGMIQWGKKIIDLVFSSQEQSTDQILQFLLSDRYRNIDNTVSDKQIRAIGLDKTSKESQKILIQQGNISFQNQINDSYFDSMFAHIPPKFKPIYTLEEI